MSIDIGRLKAIFDREMTYVSRINFLMVAWLFFSDIGFSWWYFAAIPILLLWTYVDLKYIMPKEYDYYNRKNPGMKKLLKSVKDENQI